ncbi:hypothetical protein Patl1_04365 [Pistacia atlantica]|uniref:Uncharacterized protein n=1 Tax=Pistacia atlantica TaxID=434234 RepID=A0ACC1BNS6_9ROSI|nr:hypothetical protein Patl1_04365 [Pistacia atlantica]
MKKLFLLILDDVWEKIDLDIVGIPHDQVNCNCKILLTTRSLDVCRHMMTNKEVKMNVLNEEATWNFHHNREEVHEEQNNERARMNALGDCRRSQVILGALGRMSIAIKGVLTPCQDSCLLEQGGCIGTVRMHTMKDHKIAYSINGCSAMCCSSKEIPLHEFLIISFSEAKALRVLNLSSTFITSLPPLIHLVELQALLLSNCYSLENLPSLGALYKLQELDLFGTQLRELPREMGNLSSLRELNLSGSHRNHPRWGYIRII